MKCPRCNSVTRELIVCDSCQTVGCIKCITKYSKQWICGECKSGGRYSSQESSSPESALASMFG